MPCQDQTEHLALVLDSQDRISSFALHKITCGKPVGDQILAPYIVGQPANALLSLTVRELIADLDSFKRIESFLLFKQFVAIRMSLQVWMGERSGEPGEPFVMSACWMEGDDIHIQGELAVNLISEEIKSCGSCKSCSTPSTTPAVPPAFEV